MVMTELPWDTSLQRVARAWRENMVRASTAFTPFTQVMLGLGGLYTLTLLDPFLICKIVNCCKTMNNETYTRMNVR